MAKADTLTNEEKPKKGARKSQADAASKKSAGKTSKTKAAAEAPTGSPDPAEVNAPSPASQTGGAQESGAQASALDPALLPAHQGKLGVFGGPKDRGIKPDDKLALPTGKHFTFERVRSLNPKGFYCAMRWDYHALGKSIGEGQRWWANKKLLVTNPTNGVSVVVRAVDYGPPESTGLTIAVSPGAAEALGVEVGDEVEIAFADPRLPAGIVE